MQYSDGEIRDYIRRVVREAKDTAKVDTGFLKRSIRGALIGRNKSVEFRQVVYGAYNNNSNLIEIANKIMPSNIQWKIIFIDEDGGETQVKGKSKTGRTISRKSISSENIATSKIKSLISFIRGKKKNDTAEGS